MAFVLVFTVATVAAITFGDSTRDSGLYIESDSGIDLTTAGAIGISDQGYSISNFPSTYADKCIDGTVLRESYIKKNSAWYPFCSVGDNCNKYTPLTREIVCPADHICETVENVQLFGGNMVYSKLGRCAEVVSADCFDSDLDTSDDSPENVAGYAFETDANGNVIASCVDGVFGTKIVECSCDATTNKIVKQEIECSDGTIDEGTVQVPQVIISDSKGMGTTSSNASYCHVYEVTCVEDSVTGAVTAINTRGEEVTFPHGWGNNARALLDSCISDNPRNDQDEDEPWEIDSGLAIHAGVDGSRIIDYSCDLATNEPIYEVSAICENGCTMESGRPACIGISCIDTDSTSTRARVIWDETERNLQLGVKGSVEIINGGDYSGEDVCLGDNTLLEYWCPTNTHPNVLARAFNCPNGCLDGACVSS